MTVESSSKYQEQDDIEDIAGYYKKPTDRNEVHHEKRPIYKKVSAAIFLLQEVKSGDWIIAEDFTGQFVRARQTLAVWQKFPDNTVTKWKLTNAFWRN